MLEGSQRLIGAAEQYRLAPLGCHKQWYAAAVRLYADLFTTAPEVAGELPSEHRYAAARAAVLAASGSAGGAAKLDDKECTRLRQQALEWMRAELKAWSAALERDPQKERPFLRRALRSWQSHVDLASVRDEAEIASSPREERGAWRQFWADVDHLLRR